MLQRLILSGCATRTSGYVCRKASFSGVRGGAVTALAESTTTSDTSAADELILAFAATPADDPARPALRARTIEAWLPLARHLARRYTGRGEPADDLVQVAVVGL